jgi:hypothetical protein
MTPDALEDALRAWGRAYGEQPEVEIREDARAPDVHPLAVAMRFAPGTRAEAVQRHVHRGGQQRRTLMAAGLGDCDVRIVPADFVDYVPGTRSTNSGGVDGGVDTSRHVQPIVEAVQGAWIVLWRFDTLRGGVVQAEYQRRGMTQGDKAAMLGIKLKRYRDELASGKVWLHGRLAR